MLWFQDREIIIKEEEKEDEKENKGEGALWRREYDRLYSMLP